MYWINQQNCRACLVCVDACPVAGALVVRNERPVIDLSRCTECGECVEVCPHGAIEAVASVEGEIVQTTDRAPDGGTMKPRKEVVLPVSGQDARTPEIRADAQPPAESTGSGIMRTIADVGGLLLNALSDAVQQRDISDRSERTSLGQGRASGGGTGSGGGKGGGRRQRQKNRGPGRGQGPGGGQGRGGGGRGRR